MLDRRLGWINIQAVIALFAGGLAAGGADLASQPHGAPGASGAIDEEYGHRMLCSLVSGGHAMSRPNMTEFRESVRKRVETIPPGRVLTYAEVGGRNLANVGGAMAHLVRHFDPELPWHGVVKSDGSLSKKTIDGQCDRLRAEAVEFLRDGRVDMGRFHWGDNARMSARVGPLDRQGRLPQ